MTLSAVSPGATSNATTIALQSDIQAGDLIVIGDRAKNTDASTPSEVTPSGFTRVGSGGGQDGAFTHSRIVVSFKIADGTEGGTSITGMVATAAMTKVAVVFRAAGPIETATAQDFEVHATSSDPADANIGSSAGTDPTIAIGLFASSGSTAAATLTDETDRLHYADVDSVDLVFAIYDTSPGDVVAAMGDAGSNNVVLGFYFDLTVGHSNFKIVVAVGTFTLTGIAVTLERTLTVAVDVGAFLLTGINVVIRHGPNFVVDAGAFVMTGISVVLSKANIIAVGVGSFLLTGFPTLLKKLVFFIPPLRRQPSAYPAARVKDPKLSKGRETASKLTKVR
jgi:hypothetical protein